MPLDTYSKQCVIDDEAALLDILDVSGVEDYQYAYFARVVPQQYSISASYRSLREQYMRIGEGFLLVYSITSRDSFEEISALHQQILRIKGQDAFPVIIVANNTDLEYVRQVSMKGAGLFFFPLKPVHFISSVRRLRPCQAFWMQIFRDLGQGTYQR